MADFQLAVGATSEDTPDTDCPDAVLINPCLLPTLLAVPPLLLRRVLPPAAPVA